MNKRSLIAVLLLATLVLVESCGAARRARQARKAAAARQADSVAPFKRAFEEAVAKGGMVPDTMEEAEVDTVLSTRYDESDTVETSLLDPNRLNVPPALLQAHAYRRPFQTFSAKAKVDYTGGGESHDLTANIRIRRDSAIWVSVTAAAGMVPVARILLTPDSVRMVNYLRREVLLYPIGDALTRLPFPVTFAQVQAALLGETFEPTAAITGAGRAEESDDVYLDTESQFARLRSYYRLADTVLTGEDFSVLQMWTGRIRYTDLENVFAIPMRSELVLQSTSDGDHSLNGGMYTLVVRYTDPPRTGGPLDFSFSIPKNYERK